MYQRIIGEFQNFCYQFFFIFYFFILHSCTFPVGLAEPYNLEILHALYLTNETHTTCGRMHILMKACIPTADSMFTIRSSLSLS
jgi:hypothetical protein